LIIIADHGGFQPPNAQTVQSMWIGTKWKNPHILLRNLAVVDHHSGSGVFQPPNAQTVQSMWIGMKWKNPHILLRNLAVVDHHSGSGVFQPPNAQIVSMSKLIDYNYRRN